MICTINISHHLLFVSPSLWRKIYSIRKDLLTNSFHILKIKSSLSIKNQITNYCMSYTLNQPLHDMYYKNFYSFNICKPQFCGINGLNQEAIQFVRRNRDSGFEFPSVRSTNSTPGPQASEVGVAILISLILSLLLKIQILGIS